mgnify:CR=1
AMVASTSLMDFRRALDELQSGAVPFRGCDNRVDVKNGKGGLLLSDRNVERKKIVASSKITTQISVMPLPGFEPMKTQVV